MADNHGETRVVLDLKDIHIELGEIEFLLYASFIIRCKKEVEWLDYKGIENAGYIFSRDVSLVFIKVSDVINNRGIGVYPVVVETEEQMAAEIIRLATDKAYYESESKKRLLIRKKLCFEEIAGQLQAAIINCRGLNP